MPPRAWAAGRPSHRTVASTRPGRLTAEDRAHTRQVVGSVRRHRTPRRVNLVSSRWRYSLMKWEHDPLKEIDQECGIGTAGRVAALPDACINNEDMDQPLGCS
jgi:hypothetical protein